MVCSWLGLTWLVPRTTRGFACSRAAAGPVLAPPARTSRYPRRACRCGQFASRGVMRWSHAGCLAQPAAQRLPASPAGGAENARFCTRTWAGMRPDAMPRHGPTTLQIAYPETGGAGYAARSVGQAGSGDKLLAPGNLRPALVSCQCLRLHHSGGCPVISRTACHRSSSTRGTRWMASSIGTCA